MVHLRTFFWLMLGSIVVAAASSKGATAAVVSPASIAGTYNLEVVEPTVECRWTGFTTIQQTGADFTGTATLHLVEGSSPPCIEELSGDISGQVIGLDIAFGAAFSGVGMADFKGEVGPQGILSGSWFSGPLEGTWIARPISNSAAPTIGAAGLALLIGVLGWFGASRLRRR